MKFGGVLIVVLIVEIGMFGERSVAGAGDDLLQQRDQRIPGLVFGEQLLQLRFKMTSGSAIRSERG